MSPDGLDLIFLEVDSLHDSLEFYRDALGFELVSSDPQADPPVATLRAGRTRVALAEQPPAMGRRGRGVHLFFGVADVDAYHARLRGHGIEVAPPTDEGWGGRFITTEDPDRYRLFFVTWHDPAGGQPLTGSLDALSMN
ncbi:MAG: VOC family protein [Acidobacteria bacterium]|nr:VOC family protein [Acidobacteriota bacterium]